MHTAALHLAPVLAAEKSRTAFYILGVVLVAWAMIVSVGVGMNRPSFPGDLRGQRAVIAITVILVLATITSAVATSSSPAKAGERTTTATASAPSETQSAPAPAPTTTTATTPAATTPATTTPAKATPKPAKNPATASPPVQSALKLAADPTGLLKFDTTQLSAKSGTVTIAFTNSSPAEHNLTVAQGSKVLGATATFASGAKTLTLALKPGTYTFYCSVPGHRQAGMQGTLKIS